MNSGVAPSTGPFASGFGVQTDPSLAERLQVAVRAYEAMSPVDRALLDADQRRSFVRGQCGRDPGPDILSEEVRRQRAEIERLTKEASGANADADMYAKAWQRELGRWMPAKTHHIDACAVGTRRLVEGANKAAAYAAAVDRWRTEAAIARTLGVPEPHLEEYLPAKGDGP